MTINSNSQPSASTENLYSNIPKIECIEKTVKNGYDKSIWIIEICPFCKKEHVHGSEEGFRTSHCAPSPMGTYYLVKRRDY
jgi:hypothetical protein